MFIVPMALQKFLGPKDLGAKKKTESGTSYTDILVCTASERRRASQRAHFLRHSSTVYE